MANVISPQQFLILAQSLGAGDLATLRTEMSKGETEVTTLLLDWKDNHSSDNIKRLAGESLSNL
jgi:hypothetical protein